MRNLECSRWVRCWLVAPLLLAVAGCEGEPDDATELVAEAVTSTPSITSPSSGTVFKTTSVTFTWSAGADEYWLRVGRSSGSSEVYASPSLGKATTAVVKGLPLDGSKLFVTLVSRFGSSQKTSTKSYTAAVGRGLCVVADFADKKLESWTGAGVRSLGDVSSVLALMQPHWQWLSRDTEKFKWDTIRVTLAQTLSPTAFTDWSAYREEVVRLATQKIKIADYDVNSDGIIDAVWIIGANNGVTLDYMSGGTSRASTANVFVDPQNSDSIVSGSYGNFNHELGHCHGLPDLYGPFSTVSELTLMGNSWPVPPHDFTAYERTVLGWVKPTLVTKTTRGIVLASANTTLAALKVPTARAAEYFLVEYRVTPATGYGSGGPALNGLAVYHVLENASQSQDPPLLKVVPADGVLAAGSSPDVNGLLYPGNPVMQSPFVVRSYVGNQSVFRIENVSTASGGMKLDVVISAPGTSTNLVANASVEQGTGSPTGWSTSFWQPTSTFTWASPIAHSGTHSVLVSSPSLNDAEWFENASGLTIGSSYLLCGWVKGQGIVLDAGATTGGTIGVGGGWTRVEGLSGTFDWKQICVPYTADVTTAAVACRLGFFSSLASGQLWCDDLSLELLGSAF